MINTPQYNLGKYLDGIIKKIIPHDYMLNSTNEFITRINRQNLQNRVLVSFDVESLFTNVPLKEIIETACEYVYSTPETRPPYELKHFKKLLEFATSSIFLYKDKVFKQVDGVAMGSPLGPTLANLFMAHLEKEWMKEECSPKHYCRYVDDIFCVFESMQSHNDFLKFLNTRHPNLKFTMEVGPSSIPFLDTKISVENGVTNISVYRKATNTNLLLNFNAYAPFSYKKSIISCFIRRAFTICSSWQYFNLEIDNLRKIFSDNGYPLTLFDKSVKDFLNKKANNRRVENSKADDSVHTLVLPYYGVLSNNLKRRLKSFSRMFSLNIRTVFKPFKVSCYFSLKTRCPRPLQSMIVYKFSCSEHQNISYIGKTKRHLVTRVKEHKSVHSKSAVFNHIATCNCKVSSDNFNVIYKCNDNFSLGIAEALLINQHKPILNRTLANNGASIFLKL